MNTHPVLGAAILVALAAPSAKAQIAFTFDPNASRVVNGNLATYTLSFTTAFGRIAVFGGNLSGNNAFMGPLQQQLAPGGVRTPTTLHNDLIDESIDTQFLLHNLEFLAAVEPFESATMLGGSFGLNVAARASTKALVQVVANKDVKIFYDFGVTADGSVEGPMARFQGFLGVPEPSSFALVAFSLLGGLAVRRRIVVTPRLNGRQR
jgi:hypothetical protein